MVRWVLPQPPAKSRLAEPDGIRAVRVIAAPPEEVFAFLADLENHWLITDRFVRVLSLDGPPGARSGGRVLIRAPFGLSRVATIRVEGADPPSELLGSAAVGDGTRAEVRWSLSEDGGGATRAELTAHLISASRRDRFLWAAGGRAWMQRRLERALAGLDVRCR
jgi:uncharacterized protein YndB with AHSA1/START domain